MNQKLNADGLSKFGKELVLQIRLIVLTETKANFHFCYKKQKHLGSTDV